MSERVLVSTHELPKAGSLRIAFKSEGYAVELVTPEEDVAGFTDAVLLVLSGSAGSSTAMALVDQAVDAGLPVIGYRAPGAPDTHPGVLETFDASITPGEVALVGHRLVARRRLQRVTGIVGETDAIREALERVLQIAPVDATVLLTGESGTGKELVARGIHVLSPRRHKPFIAVNVAALPDTLLESELFGHEKGAFTGAIDSRRGLFELAHGGTIFLDEIGEMPRSPQTKLLRVLEQREFMRVGGEKSIRVDVRILAATNQDLRRLVAGGDFRKDLYYRLNVLSIVLPPLRERREDIPLLVDAFVRDASERYERPFPGISEEAMALLGAHHWPGNVRELHNLVESMVVLAPGREIRASDIPNEVRGEGGRALVPLSAPPRAEEGADGLRPQLQFIFRTLVELRVDMDDLQSQFEAYRRTLPPGEVRSRPALVLADGTRRRDETDGENPELAEVVEEILEERDEPGSADVADEVGYGAVVFRAGLTMEDLERRAIMAALAAVEGNRRKAAEMLGIGERTLYRKIRKFNLDR